MTKLFIPILFFISVHVTSQTRPVTPIAISPNGGIAMARQLFSWSVSKDNASEPIVYKIKIVEIIGNQSPDEALRSNKPHFEKDSLKEAFQYPLSAPALMINKKYAWSVQASNKEKQYSGFGKALQFSGNTAIDSKKK